mgnify:CR=1 FL=1
MRRKRVLGDLREDWNVPRRALHMDIDPVGIRFILRRGGFHDRVKYGLLAGKAVVKRGRFDAYCLRDLAHADGVIAALGKKLKRFIQRGEREISADAVCDQREAAAVLPLRSEKRRKFLSGFPRRL